MATYKYPPTNFFFSFFLFFSYSMLTRFIHVPVFIASLAIGILFVYLRRDEKRIIMIYPNPDNYNEVQYKDHGGTWFEFTQTPVSCPANLTDIIASVAQQ